MKILKPFPSALRYLFLLLITLSIPLSIYFFGYLNKQFASAQTAISDTPVTKSVFLLIFNPVFESNGGVKLTTLRNWQDPDILTTSLTPILKRSSHDFVTYTIVERQEIDGWPTLSDGFVYTDDTYLQCLNNTSTCHQPDIISYQQLFTDYNICAKNVDEVWLWGGPYFGYWEYNPVTYCDKTQFVMGFSYERQVGEALHNFGHRMEFVNIQRINAGVAWEQDEATEWNKFSKIAGHCGNIHWPPGTLGGPEYNYGNANPVESDCDGYLNYPAGPFPTQTLTCNAWGCSQAGFVEWWLTHIPYNTETMVDPQTGRSIYNNWWKYYAYYDETVDGVPTPTPTATPLDQNLVGFWDLDEASGSAVNDSSGNNNTGSATGTTIIPGVVGNARRFNGSTDFISVPNNPSFSGMTDLTLSVWVKPEDFNIYDTLICKQAASAPYAYCLFWVPEFQRVAFRVNSDGEDLFSPTDSVPRNTWTHVVATYQGTTGKLSLSINGVLCTGCTKTIAFGNVGTTSTDLQFGSRFGSERLTGALDELRVYNQLLNATAITELYSNPRPTTIPTPTSIPTPTNTPTPTLTFTPTPTPSPTVTPTPTPVQLISIADTYVSKNSASSNYGTRTTLLVDGSPVYITYMKFDLTSLAGKTITSAKLRLRITDSSSSTQNIIAVSNTSWSETGMTYKNRPDLGAVQKTFPGGSAGSFIEIDITSYVNTQLGSIFSLGIDSSGSNGIDFSSREATNKPLLIIQ